MESIFEVFLNNVSDAILFLDERGKIVEVNKSASELFACSQEELTALTVDDVFPPDVASEICGVLHSKKVDTTDISEYYFETDFNFLGEESFPVSVVVKVVEASNYHCLLFIKRRSKEDELIQEFERQRKAFNALAKVTANAVSTLELDELLDRLLSRLIEVTDADVGAILLKEGEYLYGKTTIGYEIISDEPLMVKIGEGFSGRIAETGKPYFIKDTQSPDSVLLTPCIKNKGIRSVLGVPLHRNGELIGVLLIGWLSLHELKEYEVHLLEISAERCAMAILNARLYEDVKKLYKDLELRFERLPIGAIVWDRSFNVVAWNPASEKIFGYTKEEALGRNAYEFIVPKNIRFQVDTLWKRLLEGDMEAHSKSKNITKKGNIILCEWTNTPLIDEKGKIYGVLSVVRDVTAEKKTEQELKNKLAELSRKSSFENAIRIVIEGVYKSYDLQTIMDIAASLIVENIDAADSAVIYLKEGDYAVLKAANKGLLVWYQDKRLVRIPKPRDFAWKTILDGRTVACNDTDKDTVIGPAGKEAGIKSYISVPIFHNGKVSGALSISSKSRNAFGREEKEFVELMAKHIELAINNVKKIEELKKSESRFSSFFENVPGIAFICDSEGRYVLVSDSLGKLLGVEESELVGKTYYELWSPEAVKRFSEAQKQVLENKKSVQTVVRLGKKKENSIYLTNLFPIVIGNGNPTLVGGIGVDITKRIEVEEKAREQATLLDIATDAIMVCDVEGNIVYMNQKAENMYGLSDEFKGRKIQELFASKKVDVSNIVKETFEKEEWQGKFDQETEAGDKITLLSRWLLVKDELGDPKSLMVVNTDITEMKHIEKQLVQSQRLESIGTLAAGIAHDLSNILQPITISIDLLRDKVTDEKVKKWLDTIESSTRRGASLLKQLLLFTRGSGDGKTYLDLSQMIEDVSEILKETFPRDIEIEVDVSESLWRVMGDSTQLNQMLMNLCINARDAMQEGGKLSISAKNMHVDKSYLQLDVDAREGPYVVVSVSDTGKGIGKENMAKMFDPFFTTKERGEGTGLGLAIVYRIVKEHGGFIHVYSEEGKGSQFKVYIPAVLSIEQEETLSGKSTSEAHRGHGELILVVDDEPSICEMSRLILEEYGYRVITAKDGAEAVAVFTEKKDDIDVVIVDMSMPVMSGPATISALKKIKGKVKIIVSSGMDNLDVDLKSGQEKGDTYVHAVLRKPYTAEQLLTVLYEVFKN